MIQRNFPYQVSDDHSTLTGYSVEVRHDSDTPRLVAGVLLDNRWQQLQIVWDTGNPLAIPGGKIFTEALREYKLLDYESAQALRWHFHARANAEGNEYALRSRLVVHRLVRHTTVTAEEEYDVRCKQDEYVRLMEGKKA